MSFPEAGYTEYVMPRLIEAKRRHEKVQEAIGLVRSIIGKHIHPGSDESDEKIVQTRSAIWKEGREEMVWFELCDDDGRQINGSQLEAFVCDSKVNVPKAHFVFVEGLDFDPNIGPETVFSVDLDEGEIVDSDGQALSLSEVEGVIVDITNYKEALEAGGLDSAS